jgi:Family of unknown function (DUF6502)
MDNEVRSELNRISMFLLRPWIRVLLRYGVGLADLVETTKRVYVEVASEEIERKRGRVTDSSVSIMTGVHRKDVKRIQGEVIAMKPPTFGQSLISRVMELWSGSTKFQTASGRPRSLPRRSQAKGAAPSVAATFEDLLESVSKAVSARAVLDEWIRLGAVKLNAKGEVTWAKPEFTKGAELDLITRSMLMTGDRITAAIDTLDNHGENHFVWSVRGAYLTTADVMKLKALARKLALQISHRLNVEVTKLEERGRATGNGDQRFAFCSHTIHEPMAVLEKTGYKLW